MVTMVTGELYQPIHWQLHLGRPQNMSWLNQQMSQLIPWTKIEPTWPNYGEHCPSADAGPFFNHHQK